MTTRASAKKAAATRARQKNGRERYEAEGRRLESTLPTMTLPEPTTKALRTAARNVEKWTTERDRLIVEARQQGGTLREIGELVGLTHAGVKWIEDHHDG